MGCACDKAVRERDSIWARRFEGLVLTKARFILPLNESNRLVLPFVESRITIVLISQNPKAGRHA